MKKSALYGIIAAAIVAAGVGIGVAIWSMNGNSAEPAVASPQSTDNEVRVIKHLKGETEIMGTPERVVTLYPVSTGDVRALGVQPAGVLYRDWVDGWLTPLGLGLSENVTNVGDSEPNLEVISQIEPDLIIAQGGTWGVTDEVYEELNAIAPTLIFNDHAIGELDELEVAKQNFMAIADALNRHEQGVAYLEKIESHYDKAAARIEQAGMKGTKFALVQAWKSGDVPNGTVFTENSFAAKVLNNIGLVTEVPDPEDTSFGPTAYRTGVEGVIALVPSDTHLFVTYVAGDYDANPLESSPLWDNLDFVKEDRAHDIGNIRLFGQLIFAEMLANNVADALTGGSETRTISHMLGETEITGIPERVVVLEWTYAEHALALGVEPVGVADIKTMNEWVNLKDYSLSPSVTDVGLRWEPNLEIIAQLEPDLIIGDSDNNGPIYEDLSAIAPTLLFNAYPLEEENVGGFERMKEEFMTIADVLGRHDQGVAVLERMDQRIAEAGATVKASRAAGKPFALLMAGTWEGTTWLRIYTHNGQASEIIEMMGMENAWPVKHGQWGYSDADLEDLTTIQDATFFYIAVDNDNPFETAYRNNPVWANLNSVKEGRVYPIGGDTWTYGGPISAELIAEKVAAAVTG